MAQPNIVCVVKSFIRGFGPTGFNAAKQQPYLEIDWHELFARSAVHVDATPVLTHVLHLEKIGDRRHSVVLHYEFWQSVRGPPNVHLSRVERLAARAHMQGV